MLPGLLFSFGLGHSIVFVLNIDLIETADFNFDYVGGHILLALIGTFKVFEGPYILTNGGPGYASEVISTYMYKTAFSKMNYGYASAISVLIAFFCFTIYFAVKKVLNRKENM